MFERCLKGVLLVAIVNGLPVGDTEGSTPTDSIANEPAPTAVLSRGGATFVLTRSAVFSGGVAGAVAKVGAVAGAGFGNDLRVQGTIGQPAVGVNTAPPITGVCGFWSPPLVSLECRGSATVFCDGFESGDTSTWSGQDGQGVMP